MKKFLFFFLKNFYQLLSKTWRFEEHGRPPGDLRCVYGHWHQDELVLFRAFAHCGVAILISHSEDGALLTWLLEDLGYRVERGSSSRGAVRGLLSLVHTALGEERSCSLACDGPRGPIYQAKGGIVKLAERTGYPLYLVACEAGAAIRFKRSWNRAYLPLPFAKCKLFYSKPIEVPDRLEREKLESFRQTVEEELNRLKQQAVSAFGV